MNTRTYNYYTICILLIFSSATVFARQVRSLGKTMYPHSITVIGTGYVGLVLGAGLAEFGNSVICADIDSKKIHYLQQGGIPIYEPDLEELVTKNVRNKTLTFSDDIPNAIKQSEIIFIAVGTPPGDNGQADLRAVKAVAKTIGENLNAYKIICTKSTVPVGTGQIINDIIKTYSNNQIPFNIVSNPEFFREGMAIHDFFKPDRVIIGTQTEKTDRIHLDAIQTTMEEIFWPLVAHDIPFLFTTLETAELIKYASNSFLAVKISFINEISQLCDLTGADVQDVAKGMGLDKRIGKQFLNPGPGYGGSCFPKDTEALVYTADSLGLKVSIVESAIEANKKQQQNVVNKINNLLGKKAKKQMQNKTVALLGLAFKANTDDVRDTPAIAIINSLLEQDITIKAYDPIAMDNMKKIFPSLDYCDSIESAATDSDVLVILTEWEEFRSMDLEKIAQLMNEKIFLDTRNIIDARELHKYEFVFDTIGRPNLI